MPDSKGKRRERGSRHSASARAQTIREGRPRHKKRDSKGIILYVVSAVVAVLVIGSFIISGVVGGSANNKANEDRGNEQDIGQRVILLNSPHIPAGDVSTARYNSIPPTSGPHWATNWAACGIYDSEEELPDSRIVHNLEHGQIIIHYNLLDDAEIDRLENLAKDLPGRRNWLIMRPYNQIGEGQIALTAWGWLDKFDYEELDKERLESFYNGHKNNGPETIPCLTGGM